MAGITVANKYHGAHGINIMRGSVFGNPYSLQQGYTRENAIALYREWLRTHYRKKTVVYDALMKLVERVERGENITLVCCCKPQPCHGDVIKDALEKIMAIRANEALHLTAKGRGERDRQGSSSVAAPLCGR